MAKIIVKAPFYKPGYKTEKGQSRGGYAKYTGTREECEEKLAELIKTMKAEIVKMKKAVNA